MKQFAYHRAESIDEALQLLAQHPEARPIAGGTNLVDLMKYEVEQPGALLDITRLPLGSIDELDGGGGLRIGALATNSQVAHDARVRTRFPLLASALLAGATAQLRNAATTAGNLLQRTRCYYFYDVQTPCNKREPGSGCGAIGGVNRIHAILGTSAACIATHPSDMCVALAALDASVLVQSAQRGERRIAFEDLHRLPGDAPERDHTLQPDELVTAVELPAFDCGARHSYLKLRDRQSYSFALVSVAAALDIDAQRNVRRARIALGGVAHKPWRKREAEALLEGKAPDAAAFCAAAECLLDGARGQGQNDFKIELARRAIARALSQAAAGTPQSQIDKRIE